MKISLGRSAKTNEGMPNMIILCGAITEFPKLFVERRNTNLLRNEELAAVENFDNFGSMRSGRRAIQKQNSKSFIV